MVVVLDRSTLAVSTLVEHYIGLSPYRGGHTTSLAGLPLQFDGSGSYDNEGHAFTYEWDFGDGGTSTLVTPTHTYSTSGTYTVNLTVCEASDSARCNVNNGSTSAIIASVTNASPGGIWVGADSEGDQIVALITESGRFHFIDEFEFQGSGIAIVSNGNEIAVDFRFAPPIGAEFADGWSIADCSFSGSVAERATLDGTLDCTTGGGTQSSVTVNLNYQSLYELDSDLATLAGTWTDSSNPGIDVVNIDSMGGITGQDSSGSGCFYSGQVTILYSNYNAYGIEWTYSSCVDETALHNDFTFSGIGTIDNTVTPTEFILGVTGGINGSDPFVLSYEKM